MLISSPTAGGGGGGGEGWCCNTGDGDKIKVGLCGQICHHWVVTISLAGPFTTSCFLLVTKPWPGLAWGRNDVKKYLRDKCLPLEIFS